MLQSEWERERECVCLCATGCVYVDNEATMIGDTCEAIKAKTISVYSLWKVISGNCSDCRYSRYFCGDIKELASWENYEKGKK